jgi:hypothetical protein
VPTGYDFNPTVDRIRFVNTNTENARLNPNNGALASNDTDLTPATAAIIAEAYDRSFDRQRLPAPPAAPTNSPIPTTLFGINRADSTLVTQGGVNGTPSPDAGAINTVGALGFTLDPGADGGFDITPGAGLGVAFASLTNDADDLTRLYTINLATGAATAVGLIGTGTTPLRSVAVRPDGIQVTGADAGGGPHVRVFDAATGVVKFNLFPYASNFTGGVRVAAGDVTGDGVTDVITGAGPGGGPHVRVFDGLTGQAVSGPVGSFFPYATTFTGGVNVASADVNADGFDDIITGADAGGGPHVRVFSGRDGSDLRSFFPYATTFTGGVRVAAGDVNGDAQADIITAPGAGGQPQVRVFSGADNAELFSVLAFGNFTGGVNVAAGDVNGDGRADVIAGAGAGGGPNVRVFSGVDGSQLQNFLAYGAAFRGGVRVGTADTDGDGRLDILTAAGPGGGPHVRSFDGLSVTVLDEFFAYGTFAGGVFVGGQRQ